MTSPTLLVHARTLTEPVEGMVCVRCGGHIKPGDAYTWTLAEYWDRSQPERPSEPIHLVHVDGDE